jgi:uncharacterized membrane protein
VGEHRKESADERKETARIEAFSDGVFAIAITLLVLDLKVPHGVPEKTGLLRVLLAQWPAYLAFVTSFATIGIMWINHHRLFALIARSDHSLLLLNGLLLLFVTFVPFPTAIVAEYVQGRDQHVAALVYSGTFTVLAIIFNLLWRYASYKNRLLDRRADPDAVSAITRAYSFGPALYLVSFVLAFFNVPASLAVTVALAIFFALPPRAQLHVSATTTR